MNGMVVQTTTTNARPFYLPTRACDYVVELTLPSGPISAR